MKVVFRTDASLQIGIGHVMRCLTLADALQETGAQCHFICREHPGNLIELARQRGFLVTVLPPTAESVVTAKQRVETQPNYATWLGVDWNTDAEETKAGVGETVADWLIVDHYALDASWEQMLRPVCRHLMVIDDIANRSHHCDLLLDQNLGRVESDYGPFVPKTCVMLVGPQYALLRPEFVALREESLCRRSIPQLKNVLIAMGGVDMANATGRILKDLVDAWLPENCHITVVMGPHAPWLEQVRHLAAKMPLPTEIKCNVRNMAKLMAESDLAIGAAGSTSWERCSLGLPSIIGVFADNQIFIADALRTAGASRLFHGVDGVSSLCSIIAELAGDPFEISKMSTCAANITDGSGTIRVVAALGTLKLEARA